MNEPIVVVGTEHGAEGRTRVVSPAVGIWTDHPRPGALLGPGSRIGLLARLNHRFALVLPDGVEGRVAPGLPRDRALAVEYGQSLFELSPAHEGEGPQLSAEERDSRRAGTGLPPGTWAVLSPTDGVFYRRPSPASPPFVEPGSRVHTGDPVGLVEVMKTFNQIAFGGPGFPDVAVVAEIRCADAEEIRAGQILMVVR